MKVGQSLQASLVSDQSFKLSLNFELRYFMRKALLRLLEKQTFLQQCYYNITGYTAVQITS